MAPTFDGFDLVRGLNVHGVLVDPGASSALMGTDTLLQFSEQVLQPRNFGHTIAPSQVVVFFQGIDGLQEPGTCPIGLDRDIVVNLCADLSGDRGSCCPRLLPPRTLRKYLMDLPCDIFPSGDDLLTCFLKPRLPHGVSPHF